MRQISILHPGGFRALRMVHAAQPTPSPGMGVIGVEAAGVNFADCIARLGLYAASWRYAGWPFTPGFEVAGRVLALGEGVHDLDIGKRVIALTRFGGYARRYIRYPAVMLCANAPKGYSDKKWLVAVADTERLGYPPREAAQ